MDQSTQQQLVQLSTKVARTSQAVIDTLARRGGFAGEELFSVGDLRNSCVQLIQMLEQIESEAAASQASAKSKDSK